MGFKSILVIEDSEPDQFLCKFVIEEFDPKIEVIQAYDGQQALDILKDRSETPPDIIFVDINMPRMGGFGFLDAYHSQSGSIQSTVIMLTSSSQKKDKEKASNYNYVKDYIDKPLRQEHLEQLANLIES